MIFPSDVDFETKVTLETETAQLDEELPFHILFLGDWSGRESCSTMATKLSHPIEIDRDNFSSVLRKLNVALDLKFENSGDTILSLRFRDIDDFHPDRIFQQLPLFADLRDVRQRLMRADTFDKAAREVRSWLIVDENIETEQTEKEEILLVTNQPAPNDLLDQILGGTNAKVAGAQSKTVESSELSEFVAKIVKPHIIQTDTEEQSRLLMIVDEVTSDLMRKILHHPQFQALESAWRGMYLLVREIDTDALLKLFLLDISKNELAASLKSVNDLNDSDIYRMLNDEATVPWGVICGNYTFGLSIDDASTLIRLAKIGNASNTPFVSHIEPEMFSFNSFALITPGDNWQITEDPTKGKIWETIRTLPESTYLGLATPRFLARLPYGQQTDPTETFYFEEFTSVQKHEDYLWTNPSFICALVLAQSFQQCGWVLTPYLGQDVVDLPMHTYIDAGEAKTKPCAEVIMSERNCEKLLNEGLIPLISFRNADKIRLAQLQSIAYPSSELSGKWK
jgi:type VI secretion system protein ImpC